MDQAEREALRTRYQPEKVKVLFVGESPPAGGTFFYCADSELFVQTAGVFRNFFHRRVHGADFLLFFRDLGCFLVDLSPEPVNHLPWSSDKRRALVAQGEPALAEKIVEHDPGLILVTPKGIEVNVARAVNEAGSAAPVVSLPFPVRSSHKQEYSVQLREALKRAVDLGILPSRG